MYFRWWIYAKSEHTIANSSPFWLNCNIFTSQLTAFQFEWITIGLLHFKTCPFASTSTNIDGIAVIIYSQIFVRFGILKLCNSISIRFSIQLNIPSSQSTRSSTAIYLAISIWCNSECQCTHCMQIKMKRVNANRRYFPKNPHKTTCIFWLK